MDFTSCLVLLVVLILEDSEAGGHGEKHHAHIKIHLPEFIHHDHHTKVITIHHHHKAPKKEHHHHHHHHHKTHHIPHGHHYHHKKTHTTHHVSKGHGHGHHGHHGHHHHGHHHGHHGHHHHDVPTINYDPTYFEHDYNHVPSVPLYGDSYPHAPHVHGVTHTVKNVKVFDSLPGAIPGGVPLGGGLHGYEVNEEYEDDAYSSIPESFPATYNYLRGAAAAPQPSHDPFAEIPQTAIQPNEEVFAEADIRTAAQPSAFDGIESFSGTSQHDPFASAPTQSAVPNPQSSAEFPATYSSNSGFDDPANSFAGDTGGTFQLNDNKPFNGIESFSREAGIQQVIQTGGHESVVY